MTSDEHTIDLTGGGPLPSANGNGAGASNGNGHSSGSNGNGRGPGVMVVDDQVTARGGELDGIEWYPSYDRESVEQHLHQLDQERARLEQQIADMLVKRLEDRPFWSIHRMASFKVIGACGS